MPGSVSAPLDHRLLGPLPVGDVQHGPDHPGSLAVGIPQDVAPVVHVLVRPVGAAEPVLVHPGQLVAADHLEEVRLHRLAVLGVNPFEPPSRLRFVRVEAVAE
jgi:hypothetical protein